MGTHTLNRHRSTPTARGRSGRRGVVLAAAAAAVTTVIATLAVGTGNIADRHAATDRVLSSVSADPAVDASNDADAEVVADASTPGPAAGAAAIATTAATMTAATAATSTTGTTAAGSDGALRAVPFAVGNRGDVAKLRSRVVVTAAARPVTATPATAVPATSTDTVPTAGSAAAHPTPTHGPTKRAHPKSSSAAHRAS